MYILNTIFPITLLMTISYILLPRKILISIVIVLFVISMAIELIKYISIKKNVKFLRENLKNEYKISYKYKYNNIVISKLNGEVLVVTYISSCKDYDNELKRIKNMIKLKEFYHMRPVYKIIQEVSFDELKKVLLDDMLLYCYCDDEFDDKGCIDDCSKCEYALAMINKFQQSYNKLSNANPIIGYNSVINYDGINIKGIENLGIDKVVSSLYNSSETTYLGKKEAVNFLISLIDKMC